MAGLNRNITVRLLADSAQYEATMAKAGASAENLAGGLEKSGSKTGLLTNGLAMAGAAATAFGVMAVQKFAEFDAAMSTVQANTGATASQMDALRQAAIDAGASTIYSATEAADGINELGKAGLSTTDILSGGLSGALDLAASDGMQVGEAAELMATTLKQFNLTGQDATKVADALAAGAGKAVGSAHDLGYALSQAGMVAHSFGIGMEETTGTLAAFANSGMIGSDAGTSLKTMLIALANPSKEAKSLMEELGISAYDAQGKFVGLAALAGQLQTAMSGLTQEQRNQALATIFGTDAIRSATVLYEQGSAGIEDWTKAVSDSGYAAEQAAAKNDNLKGDLENLSGSMESLMISIGSGADGPLRSVVQMLDMLVDGFSQLPAPVQQTIVLATAVAGGFAAIHKAATPLATSTSAVGQALGQVIDPMQRFSAAAPLFQQAFQQIAAAFDTPTRQLETFGTTVTRTQGVTTGLATAGQGLLAMMGGPLGVGVTAAAGALMLFAHNAETAKNETEAWKQALQSDAGTADMVRQILNDVGDFTMGVEDARSKTMTYKDALAQLGITTEDYTNAVLGVKDAQESYANVLENAYQNGKISKDTQMELQAVLDENTQKISENNNANKENAEIQKYVAEANGETADAAQQATDAESILSDSFGATTDAVNEQSAALSEVIDALQTYYGFALSASNADISLHAAFDQASESIAKNGATLDLNTEQGRSNRSALNDLAEAALKAAEAHARNGESVEQITPIIDDARSRFVQFAQQMGLDEDQANALADQLGLTKGEVEKLSKSINEVPTSHNTNITLTGADGVQYQIGVIKNEFATLPDGKTIHVYMEYTPTGQHNVINSSGGTIPRSALARGGLVGYASGGRIPGMAGGGFNGYVDGVGTATSDSNLIRVSKGEFVEQASAVDYYGAGLFHDLNKLRVPRERLYKAPTVVMRQPQPTVVNQTVSPAQIEAAMVGALKRLPEVRVFAGPQEMALALAKPVSREISRQSDRGVR